MGKGDRRTRRGKISRGTHGKHWPRKEKELTPGSAPARPSKTPEK